MFDIRRVDLDKLNSATKYPSIETYHVLGERGKLSGQSRDFSENVELFATEKIDGTNVRIIFCPDESVVVGSREELLWESQDLIGSSSLGIVQYLRPVVHRLKSECFGKKYTSEGSILVLYGELYGHQIGPGKNYTIKNAINYRIFDVAHLKWDAVSSLSRENVSLWRQNGGQSFLGQEEARLFAHNASIDFVPFLFQINSDYIPKDIQKMYDFLLEYQFTKAEIDKPLNPKSEGVVLRTDDRKTIYKLRFEDYQRHFRAK